MYDTETLWLLYTIGWYVLDPKDITMNDLTGTPDFVMGNICDSIARANGQQVSFEHDFGDCDE
jgi:hypothetical protein